MNSERLTTQPHSFPLSPPASKIPGVSPELLCQQILNTAPFYLDYPLALKKDSPPLYMLINLVSQSKIKDMRNYSLAEYFRLCLSAHWLTVATFIPTDVDLAIRSKLWVVATERENSLEEREKLAQIVIESGSWDARPFSTRWVSSAKHSILSGHQGEWFSVAAAAYSSLRKTKSSLAHQIQELIQEEVEREILCFQELLNQEEGLSLLKASCILAHNFGDLDRVLENWKVPADDPLSRSVFKLTQDPPQSHSRWRGLAGFAGWLNKQRMATENHRHFALRTPRCLRKSEDLLLPIGPFFDEWGQTLAKHPILTTENIGEIATALVEGWVRLEKTKVETHGYARALCGILDHFPGGMSELSKYLPSSASRALKSGPLRSLCSIPRERFEKQWAQFAFHAKKKFKTGGF